MLGVAMYYSVKTLYDSGRSQRAISRELNISRNSVKRLIERFEAGDLPQIKVERESSLSPFTEVIRDYLSSGLTARKIHEKLCSIHGLSVCYTTVSRYVGKFKSSEVFVPLTTQPGEESQMDFGYAGRFYKDGKLQKCYIFCMVLSCSRYSYYDLVTTQEKEALIRYHICSFEFFGGVPFRVKLDNLKSGVLQPCFYKPVFQKDYHDFLKHYGSSGVTCRIARGQDKGKVESGIKYVKNNFLKGLDTKDYEEARCQLHLWRDEVCNKRVHGTTRKIPLEEFLNSEKAALLPLPSRRFEIYDVFKRSVNNYGHIMYSYNFYSVPFYLAGKEVSIRTNGNILKVYDGFAEVAVHEIHKGKGQYITRESDKPPHKQSKPDEKYFASASETGEEAYRFLEREREVNPSWRRVACGIKRLTAKYGRESVNLSCHRANNYGISGYINLRHILEKGLYKELEHTDSAVLCSGYSTNLEEYDKLFEGGENGGTGD
ncbi:MAG: IS21 family transposase [bacterium]